MTKDNILKQQETIISYLRNHRLKDALQKLKSLSGSGVIWDVLDEINRVEESYKMMLNYATQGVDDPSRALLYEDLKNKVYVLLDRVVRCKLSNEEATIYYNTLRYEQLQIKESISSLLEKYIDAEKTISLYNLSSIESKSREAILAKENFQKQLFNRVWITFPFNVEDEESINTVFQSNKYSSHFQEHILSALLLGMIEFYDVRRLKLMLVAYQSENETVSVKALIAILLSLHLYQHRINDSKILNQLDAIRELQTWDEDVKTAYLEFIRTRDTERISKKMQDELIPQMMKLRPDIYQKLNDSTSSIDISSIENNPEWEEILENSGITEKIKELNKLQEDGGDLFMSTFAHLKSFPFFSDVSNWFLPFSLEHSIASDALGSEISIIGKVIENAPFLCNSDKYSFLLSLASIPIQQKQMMLSQFEQQREALNNAGMSLSDMIQPKQRKNIMNKYLQDLYRFFKLYRRKGEFKDPFVAPINLVNVPILKANLDDVDSLTIVAEFYFSRNYFNEALSMYLLISNKVSPTAQIYQKIGYCYQQQGDVNNALKYYEQAELLNAESVWTLRRIAGCYRALSNPQKALQYYEKISQLKSDDLGITINIGHCYLELGDYKEAVKNYYKVEFLDENSTKAWRPLAWCLLLLGEYSQSRSYYDKILTDNPSSEDFLNMGHLAFAQKNIQDAISYYKNSIKDGNINTLIDSLKKDEKFLVEMGIDVSLIPLVIDAILYLIE